MCPHCSLPGAWGLLIPKTAIRNADGQLYRTTAERFPEQGLGQEHVPGSRDMALWQSECLWTCLSEPSSCDLRGGFFPELNLCKLRIPPVLVAQYGRDSRAGSPAWIPMPRLDLCTVVRVPARRGPASISRVLGFVCFSFLSFFFFKPPCKVGHLLLFQQHLRF